MKIKHLFPVCFFLLILISSTAACQKISVPKDAQIIELPPPKYMDEVSNHIGEFVKFYGEIEIPYNVVCAEEINGDDACPLRLNETKHIINVIVGLNKNNVTSSGKIIYSDGSGGEASIFGVIPAGIIGLVKECDSQKSCVIDVYQLDGPTD